MKKGVFIVIAGVVLLFFFCSLAFVSAASSSKDVGYILISKRNVNTQITDLFSSLNLTYDLIEDSKINAVYNAGNLSKYRLLFIDDVRLTNAKKLPIYNYSSVIMNSFYGYEWGLTNRNGVSQLTYTDPLNVKVVSGGLEQAYTLAWYPGSHIAIPYYHLLDINKAQNLQSVARTYTGDGSIGDVVAYGSKGIILANGKMSGGRTCFFGIAKTEFWTDEARNLFLDCMGYVASKCSSDANCPQNQVSGPKYCRNINAPYNNTVYQNIEKYTCINPKTVKSECVDDIVPVRIENCTDICVNGKCENVVCMNDLECDDSDNYTADKCINPATLSSSCTHTPINCLSSLDCGTNGFVGNAFCSDKNVVRNYLTFSCNEAGTISSYCTNLTSQQNIQTCTDACVGGECKKITCRKDTDCDDNNTRTEDICLKPGTLDSSCKNQPIACFENLDCGDDGWNGDLFCSGKNLSRKFISYMCNNPGTSSSFCTNSTSVLVNQTCADACVGGECKKIECYKDSDCDDGNVQTEDKCFLAGTIDSYCTNDKITCFSNIDCGTNTLSGNLCSGRNVVNSFLNYTCINPGNANSRCSNFSGENIIQTCAQQCRVGRCIMINCTKDLDCDDGNGRTLDICVNLGTTASYCRNTEVNCLNNLDCGFTGFSGKEFCSSNKIFKYYQNSTCINPGTLDSNCVISQFPLSIQDCDDKNPNTVDTCVEDDSAYCKHEIITCFNNSQCSGTTTVNTFCVGKEVWKNVSSGMCLNAGTTGSSCSLVYNQVFNNTCSDACVNGKCEKFTCTRDLDCGINTNSSNFCSLNDLFKNYFTFTCNNPNTILSFCSNSTQQQLVEDCGEDSYSNYSANYCKGNAVYKSRAFYDRGCSSSSCFVYAVTQEVNVENCTNVCENGACGKVTCKNDSECGISGFTGASFCSQNNVNQNFIEFDCVNEGTVNSYCTNSTTSKNVGSCLFGCSNGGCTC